MKCRRASRSTNSLDNPPYRIHNWLSPTENTATVDWKTMSLTAGTQHDSAQAVISSSESAYTAVVAGHQYIACHMQVLRHVAAELMLSVRIGPCPAQHVNRDCCRAAISISSANRTPAVKL